MLHTTRISIIAALSENRVIGRDNKLPWHIPEDMKRFRALTTGHVVIMGRKTYESIGRPLPNRTNIVITRDKTAFLQRHPELVSGSRNKFGMTETVVCTSLDEAIKKAKTVHGSSFMVHSNQEIFIIGGGEIYKQALPLADRLYLTLVKENIEGDTYFPDYSRFKKLLSKEEKSSDGINYEFIVFAA